MNDHGAIDPQWRSFYRFAAMAAFGVVVVMVSEIVITALPGGARQAGVTTMDWLTQYRDAPLMALRNLGGINLIAVTLGLPVSLALWASHREKQSAWAHFALVLALMGATFYFSVNTALPMLALSDRYWAAGEAGRSGLFAAAEALIVRGQSHTPGTALAFLISSAGTLVFSLVMLRGGAFSRSTAIVGIVGSSCLMVFEVVSAFVPALYDPIFAVVLIGGVASIVWEGMVAARLLAMGRARSGPAEGGGDTLA